MRFCLLLLSSASLLSAGDAYRLYVPAIENSGLGTALHAVVENVGYQLEEPHQVEDAWLLPAPLVGGFRPSLRFALQPDSGSGTRELHVTYMGAEKPRPIRLRSDFLVQAVEQELGGKPGSGDPIPRLNEATFIALSLTAPYAAIPYSKDKVLLDKRSYGLAAGQLLFEIAALFLVTQADSKAEASIGVLGLVMGRAFPFLVFPEFKRVNHALNNSGYSYDPGRTYLDR